MIRVDLRTGNSEQILSGFSILEFQVSADGKQIVYSAHAMIIALTSGWPRRAAAFRQNRLLPEKTTHLFWSTTGT
jgi:hypothetical protein